MEEHSLIKGLKEGDNEDFRYIYEKYKEKLNSYVYYKIKNKSEAEDLVQEIFTKVYKNIGLYDETQSTFYNFLLSNANQIIAEYSRKNISREQKVENIRIDSDITYDDEAFAVYDKFEGEYNLKELLDELPHDQREVFILVCVKHMKYKDVERLINKSDLSVKSLLFRARRNLKRKIAEKYPEVAREYGFKRTLKMIVVSCVCVGLISGFTYATWRAYQNSHYKNTFTIADTAQDIQGEVEETISKQNACEKINSDLKILGINLLVNEDDLHLFRDYKSDEICWEDKNEELLLKVSAYDGRLVNFAVLGQTVGMFDYSEDMLRKLNIIDGYELASREVDDGIENIEYAKKYGDIFNSYQSATIGIKNGKIFNIFTVNYAYEDKDVLVSKEEALKILKENGIDADDVELAIENVGVLNPNEVEGINEEISEENVDKFVFNRKQADIRKVWKTGIKDGNQYCVDVNTKKIIHNKDIFIEEKEYKK